MPENTEKQYQGKKWIYIIAGIATGGILCVILMVSVMPSI